MGRLQQSLLTISILCLKNVLCSEPREITWSNKRFGPDGPWQAVTVSMGSNYSELVVPSSTVDLYPGGSWESRILLSSICDNKTLSTVCYGNTAGLFDSDISVTYDNNSIELPPYGPWSYLDWGYTDAVPVYTSATRAIDWMTIGGVSIPDVDLITLSAGYQIYPSGKAYPLEVGTLSLGCPNINQTFGASIKINTTFVTSYLYDQHGSTNIPSYSYGMHIGSASLGIPGSLLLGGYDQSRVMGDVSAQSFSSGSFPIELYDMSLGVAEGGSPWSFPNQTGLLARGNSSLESGLQVIIDPVNPYIYLPQSSCDAIAAELPVTYEPDYGLYFWNTSDPQYDKIVSSPALLAFKFSKNSLSNEVITIKVPFALLNLTLEAPLVKKPTPYFPCMATNSTPVLGRAFLQAAFVGVNWLGGKWFLAQAPGPGGSFIVNSVTISEDEVTIPGSSNSWETTWKNSWNVIETKETKSNPKTTTKANHTTSDSTTESNGLPTNAKIGVIVGSTVGGVMILALCFGLFIRRRRQRREFLSQNENLAIKDSFDNWSSAHQSSLAEAPDSVWNAVNELDHTQQMYEMGVGKGPFYEMDGEIFENGKIAQQGPFEMPERTSVLRSSKFI